MNVIKKIFGNLGSRVWFIVTVVLVVLLLVVSILAMTTFYDVFGIVFGRDRAIYKEHGVQAAYVAETESK